MIDLMIIGLYLCCILGLGFYHGLRTKTMRAYSVADKSYSTPMMIATMVGATIGGGSTLGLSERVYQLGLLGFIAYIGFVIELSLIAYFIVPRVAQFKDALSPGDIMEKFYGKFGRVCTGAAAIFKCVAAIGGQIFAIGLLLQYFTGASNHWAIWAGSAVVAIYSAFGGIKTVTFTDAIQFAVLSIAIPMLCNIALSHLGGYQALFSAVPDSYLTIVGNPALDATFLSVLFLSSIPTLNPAILQRLLVARDERQLRISVWSNALIVAVVFSIVGCIGFVALVLNPNLDARMAFPYLIQTILPPGLRGFVLVGMVAVVVSMADSYLNVVGITFIRDVVKPLTKRKMSDRLELRLTQISTFIFGIAGVGVAFSFPNLFSILVKSRSLWVPLITFPLLAGLMGFSVSRKSFVVGAIAATTVGLIWQIYFMDIYGIEGMFMGFVANAIAFSINHYLEVRRQNAISVFYRRHLQQAFENLWFAFTGVLKAAWEYRPTLENLLRYSSRRVESHGAQYSAFGIFAMCIYVIPYGNWGHSGEYFCNLLMFLRFFGGVLCFLLLVRDGWPEPLKRYLPLYWHFTLLYNLPFLMVFTLLESQGSWQSLNNMLLGFFLLTVLVDWRSFLAIVPLGISAAFGFFWAFEDRSFPEVEIDRIWWAIYMCGFAILIGLIFSRANEKGNLNQINLSRAAGGKVIHEIRILLSSVSMLMNNFNRHVNTLFSGHKLALQAGLPVQKMSDLDTSEIRDLPKVIKSQIKLSFNTMDVLLSHLKDEGAKTNPELCSALQCCTLAVERYPFQDDWERKLVSLNLSKDFYFWGHQGVLMNILFNLIRNGLKQIHRAQKGTIEIWIEETKEKNEIHVRDTAVGISQEQFDKLFQPFASGDKTGAGLGLYFCKQEMQRIAGDIVCKSLPGEFAEFILIYNKVSKYEQNTVF